MNMAKNPRLSVEAVRLQDPDECALDEDDGVPLDVGDVPVSHQVGILEGHPTVPQPSV